MKIPYVVIVQPHLLRDKGHVRLRRILFDSFSQSSGNSSTETFVALENLAMVISAPRSADDTTSSEPSDGLQSVSTEGNQSGRTSRSNMECIYVDHDQFYSNEKQVSKSDTSNWKAVLKALKSVTQRSEAYMDSMAGTAHGQRTTVIAVNLSFWILRDFGTSLMRRSEPTTSGALTEMTEKYPKHKKILKTVAVAVDSTMKTNGYWGRNGEGAESKKGCLMILLLYSKTDDRFDMISLGDEDSHENHLREANSGRHHRRHH